MKTLELLGLQSDGRHLTLNDPEGNRYSLEITEELRSLVRKDTTYKTPETSQNRQVTPREIQAYVRAGKTVEEISKLTGVPASRIDNLAYPILDERDYTARLARSFATTGDPGALTLDELVATRLASRGVRDNDIEWDAIRISGQPWTVIARYTSAERERQASWHVDLNTHAFKALDEEAVWLSETPLLPHGDAWRAPNTPPLSSDSPKVSPLRSISSASSPLSPLSADSAPSVQTTEDDTDKTASGSSARIDAVLAGLDARRGIPTSKEDYSSLAHNTDARTGSDTRKDTGVLSHTADEESTQSPHGNTADMRDSRETIFDLPVHDTSIAPLVSSEPVQEQSARKNAEDNSHAHTDVAGAPDLFSSAASPDSSESSTENTPSATDQKTQSAKRIRRSNRPSMPTWDEIVFGKKD